MVKRSRIISILLALLFIPSTAVSFSPDIDIQNCQGQASCVFDKSDIGWLEVDPDKDGNDLELFSYSAVNSEFSPRKTKLSFWMYSRLENLLRSHSQIRAPPPLL